MQYCKTSVSSLDKSYTCETPLKQLRMSKFSWGQDVALREESAGSSVIWQLSEQTATLQELQQGAHTVSVFKARDRHPCKLQKEKHQCQAKTETVYCLNSYKNKVSPRHWKASSDDVNFNKRHWQNEDGYLNAGWSSNVFCRCKLARKVILWEDR